MIENENIVDRRFDAGQTTLMLTNQRAVYWPAAQCLIIADLHLGKATHFRQHGIPIPTAVAERDLARLAQLIAHYRPARLLINGDFFHASANREVALFATWRAAYPALEILLIRGNHDRLTARHYRDMGIAVCSDEHHIDGLHFVHDPAHITANGQAYSICGHVHPGVLLREGRQTLRLPCYVANAQRMVLPAFSLFTGLNTRFAQSDDESIVVC